MSNFITFDLIIAALEQGCSYGIAALGILFSFRIIRFPDLSVDGTFALGGAITASLIYSGNNALLATILAILIGGIAGALTASLSLYLHINRMLSGILVMISLYSINLRIMGRSNIPLLSRATILSSIENSQYGKVGMILFFITLISILIVMMFAFLKMEVGLLLRATGDNPNTVTNAGKRQSLYVVCGLAISNALVAFSGSVIAQRQGFADVNMGTGIIIVLLACLFIGDVIIKSKKLIFILVRVIIGTIVYNLVISIGLRIGIAPSDLKLVTALIVILVLALPSRSDLPVQEERIL